MIFISNFQKPNCLNCETFENRGLTVPLNVVQKNSVLYLYVTEFIKSCKFSKFSSLTLKKYPVVSSLTTQLH